MRGLCLTIYYQKLMSLKELEIGAETVDRVNFTYSRFF